MSLIPQTLEALEERVRLDLEYLGYPPENWVLPCLDTAKADCDVLIVGAGLCGQTAAFALKRLGVANILLIDHAPMGLEGPWVTYARMPTLRTRKDLNGPDLGIPSLTYRSWHQARYGERSWDSLLKIGRPDWMDYLVWVRRIVGVQVRSQTSLQQLQPDGERVAAILADAAGVHKVRARKVVLATGREGAGGPRLPRLASFDLRQRAGHPVYHSTDRIDFAGMRGCAVAVLGTGASAFDNAGCALEAGAKKVVMFGRAPELPRHKKNTWASFDGVKLGQYHLDNLQRLELHSLVSQVATPPPDESIERCIQHVNFELRCASPWKDLRPVPSGLFVHTPEGEYPFDAAIVATGFDIALEAVPHLSLLEGNIRRWRDVLPEGATQGQVGNYPFLGPSFELMPRRACDAESLRHLHLFNAAVGLSHGALGSEIPGLHAGATRLAQGIATALFTDSIEHHLQSARNYEEPVLQRWYQSRGRPEALSI
jgi:FAD-dependent urate hydroxylase